MLSITISPVELWDGINQEFIQFDGIDLELEHSLLSISKWESKWNKLFLSKQPKTREETIDYIRCMTLTENVAPEVYNYLTNDNIKQIGDYIDAPMTASTVPKEKNQPKSREQVSSELIYYWMLTLNIPFECESWHLNRLLMLIEICSYKNKKPKKTSMKDRYQRNAKINAANRRRFNSKG